MANQAENNIDPWGRSLGETLRRWWWIPAVLAVIGAVVGGVAGMRTPKSAEAVLRVQSAADNSDAVNQQTQSALAELDTHEVFEAAAKKLGVPEGALRARTKVTVVSGSTILSVVSTSPDAKVAVADANAVAEAGVDLSSQRLQNELDGLTASTSKLISSARLKDANAESQRVSRLGAQLADNQGALLTQSRQLALLQNADLAAVTSTSPSLLAGMGLIGGGLLGTAIALLFGGRRGRMNSMREMRRLYPNLEFIPARDVPAILSMEAGTSERIVLSGVRAPAGAVRGLVEPVSSGVHAAGRDTFVTEDVAQFGATRADGSVTVLQTPLSSAIVKRVARDPRSILMVLVRPHKTRFEWLDEHASQFGERTFVVVDG